MWHCGAVDRKVRATDVAARAQVSRTAVSFVLNGRGDGNVAPEAQERIRAAARELGYQPDRVARSLRLGRTHVIGFVTDAIATSPFAGRILGAAMDRAQESGYVLVAFDSEGHPDLEQAAIDELTQRSVDGLVYASMGLRELTSLPQTDLPMTLANCYELAPTRDAVIPDDGGGAGAAARHLLALGHRHITMLTGPGPGKGGNISGPLRSKGFRAALARAGVPTSDSPVVVAGWTIDDGYRAAMHVLCGPDGVLVEPARRPTAVFAVTDRVATGVLLAASRLGLDIPRDLSVVGFDDQEQLAAHVVPPLTTIALPHREMGRRATELLLDRLAGRPVTNAPVVTRLSCPLVVRGSTAPPDSGGRQA